MKNVRRSQFLEIVGHKVAEKQEPPFAFSLSAGNIPLAFFLFAEILRVQIPSILIKNDPSLQMSHFDLAEKRGFEPRRRLPDLMV